MLTNFIRRILGAVRFPLKPTPLADIEPQVYQPPSDASKLPPPILPPGA